MLAASYQNAIASFFKALGNESRIEILQLLQKSKEMSVKEICKQLGKKQYHISRHLTCLRNCGLVATRRDGKMVFYSLNGGNRIIQILTMADEHVQLAFENILACKIVGVPENA